MIKSLPSKGILAKPYQELLHCSYQLCIKSQQKFRVFFVSVFRAPVEVVHPEILKNPDFFNRGIDTSRHCIPQETIAPNTNFSPSQALSRKADVGRV